MTRLFALFRTFNLTGWLILVGLLALILVLGRCNWDAHQARREAEAMADRIERAAEGRETAATQRHIDRATIADTQKERDHEASIGPDGPPDDGDMRHRCRQLRDAGHRDIPACRRFEG